MGWSFPILGVPLGNEVNGGIITRALKTQPAALEVLMPFDDAAGLVARDISGNSRHGAYSAVGVSYRQPAPDATRRGVTLNPAAGNVFIDVYNAATKDIPATGQFSVMICAQKPAWDDANHFWLNLQTDGSNRLTLGETSGSATNELRFLANLGGTNTYEDITEPTGFDWYCCLITVDQANDAVKLFINGVLVHTLTNTGAWVGSLAATTTLVGAATKASSAEHDGGLYGFGLWSTTLSDAEAIAITGMYTAKCYVDVAAGNNANTGLSSALAVADLATALGRLTPMGGTIYANAPEANPIVGPATWNQPGTITIRPLGAAWHTDSGTAWTSGWTADGGGVYHRALASSPGIVTVPSMVDGDGYATLLTQNTSTPTAPTAGQWGHNSGNLYVHLPGSVDPATHTVKAATAANCLVVAQGTVGIRDLVSEYGITNGIVCTGGSLLAAGCVARYSGGSGFYASTVGTIIATLCTGERNMNDGFNAHSAGILTLNNCIGRYNQDEGASPHDTASLTITGGRYHHNQSGGIVAINEATLTVSGARFDHNGLRGVAVPGDRGGIYVGYNVTGSIADTECDNNWGEGVYINTSQTFTVTNLNSHDNTEDDVITDQNPVTVEITSAAGAIVYDTFEISIEFGEAVTGLAAGDFVGTNCTIDTLAGSGTSYTANINPTESGLVGVSLPEGAAANAAERWNSASNTLERTTAVFGASWDGSSSATLTRTGQAVGLTAQAGVDAGVVTNDFDTLWPWSGITEVTVGSDVFMRVPKFYIRKTAVGAARTWEISRYPFPSSGYLPMCFWDFTNSVELDYVDVGKYPASLDGANLASRAGVYPLINKTIVEMRGYAQANGAGYQLLDIHVVDLLQVLMYIEFATLNLQSVMAGYTNGRYTATDLATVAETGVNRIIVANATAAYYAVGQAISVGTSQGGNQVFYGRTITDIVAYDGSNMAIEFDGDPVNIAVGNMLYNTGWKNDFSGWIAASSGSLVSNSTGKYPCVWRGIENPWGNVYQFVDGLNINENQAWVCEDADDYTSNLFASPYEQLAYVNHNASGYPTVMGFDASQPFAALPTAVGGGTATYFADYYYQNTGQRIARLGGRWDGGSFAGPSFWFLSDASSNANVTLGARLLRKAL